LYGEEEAQGILNPFDGLQRSLGQTEFVTPPPTRASSAVNATLNLLPETFPSLEAYREEQEARLAKEDILERRRALFEFFEEERRRFEEERRRALLERPPPSAQMVFVEEPQEPQETPEERQLREELERQQRQELERQQRELERQQRQLELEQLRQFVTDVEREDRELAERRRAARRPLVTSERAVERRAVRRSDPYSRRQQEPAAQRPPPAGQQQTASPQASWQNEVAGWVENKMREIDARAEDLLREKARILGRDLTSEESQAIRSEVSQQAMKDFDEATQRAQAAIAIQEAQWAAIENESLRLGRDLTLEELQATRSDVYRRAQQDADEATQRAEAAIAIQEAQMVAIENESLRLGRDLTSEERQAIITQADASDQLREAEEAAMSDSEI